MIKVAGTVVDTAASVRRLGDAAWSTCVERVHQSAASIAVAGGPNE